ncbi:DUF397 domain-containing protein [Sphaerisporangium melleum]|nr:DUF397 domain-containing protein [Sphaerisporangium melleum]
MDLSGAKWRKSSWSSVDGGQCVEVAANLSGIVAVRDGKRGDGAVLVVTKDEWRVFLSEAGAGGV